MAQVQGFSLLKKSSCLFRTLGMRSFSAHIEPQDRNIKKLVFVSQSNDVYTNLALENWLYANYDFSDRHVLLISRNDPCVVIGDNQNPWVESNVQQLKNISKKGVILARRTHSGGPAVYQDEGLLNLTFFANKDHHDMSYNMETLKRALFRKFSLNAKVTQNKDVVLRNRKVTDSTFLVGQRSAYQHCSLLVNVKKADLLEALKTESPVKPKENFKYMNLVDENYRVTVDDVITAVGWEYMRTPPPTTLTPSLSLAGKNNCNELAGGFHLINPTDEWFPGLGDIRNRLSNWDWVYGKTPQFTLNRSFPVPGHLAKTTGGLYLEINITMIVESARIKDVTLFVPAGLSKNDFSGEIKILTNLKGRRFTEDALKFLEDYFKDAVYANDKDRFVSDCVKQVMTSV